MRPKRCRRRVCATTRGLIGSRFAWCRKQHRHRGDAWRSERQAGTAWWSAAGRSSWRSASRYWHRRTELRGKDENPIQDPPAPQCRHTVMSIPVRRNIMACGVSGSRGSVAGCVEQGSAQGEVASPSSIGEHAVVAQPRESAREHMKKEAADELAGVEAHHLALVAVSVVAPSEANMLAIEVDEAMIGDGGLVGVAPEVGDDIGGACERRFSILPIISDSRCATRTIRYLDKRPLCFARRPTTESAIFE